MTGSYTQPDSIAVLGSRIFVGFQNGVAKDGTDGKTSTIVEFRLDGSKVQTFSVPGHNDGLKSNPATGQLWAVQNEDGNPNLVIINPDTGAQTMFGFVGNGVGGGYDDVAFRNGQVFLSGSNPAANPNTAPAVVSVVAQGNQLAPSTIMSGTATATDVVTNQTVTLNLQDPDSMIFSPNGDLILDSQADDEIIIIQHPGEAAQRALRLPISLGGKPAEIDDTVFARTSDGFLLVSDFGTNTVYRIDTPYFPDGAAYSAGDVLGIVARLNFETGALSPIVVGLTAPKGMAFVANQVTETGGSSTILNGRFQVSVSWTTPNGQTGAGHVAAAPASNTTTSFWFFSPDNVELVVKVVDGRAFNNKSWVFGGSLTNVAYTLTVKDTTTGSERTYLNAQGAQTSFSDTSAF